MLINGHAIEFVNFNDNPYDCEHRPNVIQAVAYAVDSDGCRSVQSVCEVENPDFEAGKKRLISVLRKQLKGDDHGGFTKALEKELGYA